jgi:hypothetical protein
MGVMFQRQVYKYPLASRFGERSIYVEAPDPQRVVLFGAQGRELFVWVEVIRDRPEKVAEFIIYGTGQEIEEGDAWVGSCQVDGYVWHLYQRGGWD